VSVDMVSVDLVSVDLVSVDLVSFAVSQPSSTTNLPLFVSEEYKASIPV
jgi:hypothetical protein